MSPTRSLKPKTQRPGAPTSPWNATPPRKIDPIGRAVFYPALQVDTTFVSRAPGTLSTYRDDRSLTPSPVLAEPGTPASEASPFGSYLRLPGTPPLSAHSAATSLPPLTPPPLLPLVPLSAHFDATEYPFPDQPSPTQGISGMMNAWTLATPPRGARHVPDLSPLDAELRSPEDRPAVAPIILDDPSTPYVFRVNERKPATPLPYRQPSWSEARPEPGPSAFFSPTYSMAPNALHLSTEQPYPSDDDVSDDESIASQWLEGRRLPPDFVRQYDLRDELGAGGFGFVCAAVMTQWTATPGREVAVKFIFKNKLDEAEDGIIFGEPAESFILGRCRHPGVIAFVDLFQDNTFWIMVQELHGDPWSDGHTLHAEPHVSRRASEYSFPAELTSGPVRPRMGRRASHDLFEAIETTRFTEHQARHIFWQIVSAVKYLHDRGVYHRDLKDENIVIDRDLVVKIIDFGSAVVEDKVHLPSFYDSFRGTQSYASPEVMHGYYYRAGPCDVWSLGVILSILLTGEQPFADLEDAVCRRYRNHRLYSDHAKDLMDKMLRPDPEARWDIGRVAHHPWFTAQFFSHQAPPRAPRVPREPVPQYWVPVVPPYGQPVYDHAGTIEIVTGTASRAQPRRMAGV